MSAGDELAALRAERDAVRTAAGLPPGDGVSLVDYVSGLRTLVATTADMVRETEAQAARWKESLHAAEATGAGLSRTLAALQQNGKRLQDENTRLTGGVRGVVESNTLRERSGWSCSTCMHHTEDSDHGGKEGALAALHWPHCAVPALRDLLATSDKTALGQPACKYKHAARYCSVCCPPGSEEAIRQPPRTTADEYAAAHGLADPSRAE